MELKIVYLMLALISSDATTNFLVVASEDEDGTYTLSLTIFDITDDIKVGFNQIKTQENKSSDERGLHICCISGTAAVLVPLILLALLKMLGFRRKVIAKNSIAGGIIQSKWYGGSIPPRSIFSICQQIGTGKYRDIALLIIGVFTALAASAIQLVAGRA